jgi:hypothetical protein
MEHVDGLNEIGSGRDHSEADDVPLPPAMFAELASQATEELLLSDRAVQIAEAKLAARVVIPTPGLTPAGRPRRLRDRFGLERSWPPRN